MKPLSDLGVFFYVADSVLVKDFESGVEEGKKNEDVVSLLFATILVVMVLREVET
ncbi:hypothetical protein [Peribacillus sp. NPDC096540]|uniref:hypothetical protein n=1 Tax=Peribacillus sp. NPDC096540 TaxID=3390612 RepID=UPI003CFE0B36